MARLIALILLCLIASCRCRQAETYGFSPDAKAYFTEFGAGSYWVYQNEEDQSDVDTLTLLNKTAGVNYEGIENHCDGDFEEYAHYQLLSAKTGDTLYVRNTTNANIDIHLLTGRFHLLPLSCSLNFMKSSGTFSVNEYAHDVLNVYPTLTVLGNTYTDVVSMTFTQVTPVFPEQAPRYHYAKHVGLLEFSVYDEAAGGRKSFALKEYAIVK